jgi:hypothetical protein
VPEEEERRAVAARDPGYEVRALGRLRDQFALDAVGLEVVAQELGRRGLVSGWVRRVDPDEALQEVGDLVTEGYGAQRRVPRTSVYSRSRKPAARKSR